MNFKNGYACKGVMSADGKSGDPCSMLMFNAIDKGADVARGKMDMALTDTTNVCYSTAYCWAPVK